MRSARKRTHFLGLVVALVTMMGCANAWTGSPPPAAAPSASPTPPNKEIVGKGGAHWKSDVELLELATDSTGSGKGMADWFYLKAKIADKDKAAPSIPSNSYITSPVPTDDGKAVVIKVCVARLPGVCPSPGSGADRPWPATPTPSTAPSATAAPASPPQGGNVQGEWIIPSPTPTPQPLGVITFDDPSPSPAAK